MSSGHTGSQRGGVNIVGAGPTGALLAILLRRRGFDVTVYEARRDPRGPRRHSKVEKLDADKSAAVEPVDKANGAGSGRSINLALAARGIRALEAVGLASDIIASSVPMRGRFVHGLDGSRSLYPYGRQPGEVIYSVSRHRLNQTLLNSAANHRAELRFEHRLEDIDFDDGAARIRNLRLGQIISAPLQPLLATDGAGSVTRRRMAAAGLIKAREADLEHAYKELSIPAGPRGEYMMTREALHIWPRGNFMLIALPNTDGSFTATLFLPKHGPVSFAALDSTPAIECFLASQFPDAHALMPNGIAEFQERPTGSLGTVYANEWHVGGMTALVGDAAHAIVPFHGQGMNCCFEDCIEFDACLERQVTAAPSDPPWEAAFEDFFTSRKANTDAIAAMALENYLEMRERVVDPTFRLQQELAQELERRHPQRFIPRYSMVMFHHEIPYVTAQQRGIVQSRLLAEFTADISTLEQVDYGRAAQAIKRELSPIARQLAPA